MTEKQKAHIERHGKRLLAIYPNATQRDPIKLCKRLRRIETQHDRASVAYCNGTLSDEHAERAAIRAAQKAREILGDGPPIIVNRDPRGYSLKIPESYMREHGIQLHRDWGGYGIIAPEISPEGE